MTLDELRAKEDRIKATLDALTSDERQIALVYLYKGYDLRISDCERALARALFDGGTTKK